MICQTCVHSNLLSIIQDFSWLVKKTIQQTPVIKLLSVDGGLCGQGVFLGWVARTELQQSGFMVKSLSASIWLFIQK